MDFVHFEQITRLCVFTCVNCRMKTLAVDNPVDTPSHHRQSQSAANLSTPIPQNNYIQKGISRRIVSHASLRMLKFLASVMREFYEEIDRKNRIFGRKTDILRKCVARCAILLNIYGKKDCFDVSSYNWAHKHHFIVRKTKKTYLSDCENSHEKQQTGIFCKLKTCFYLPISG